MTAASILTNYQKVGRDASGSIKWASDRFDTLAEALQCDLAAGCLTMEGEKECRCLCTKTEIWQYEFNTHVATIPMRTT